MAGYAKPRQSASVLLDSLSPDVLVVVGYGLIIEHMNQEQREKLDADLDRMDDAPARDLVEKVQPDGTVKQISAARLDRVRRNLAAAGKTQAPKGGGTT